MDAFVNQDFFIYMCYSNRCVNFPSWEKNIKNKYQVNLCLLFNKENPIGLLFNKENPIGLLFIKENPIGLLFNKENTIGLLFNKENPIGLLFMMFNATSRIWSRPQWPLI